MLTRLSLRARLVLGVLVLAAAGLTVADVATFKSLGSFLIQRTDNTLDVDHTSVEHLLGGDGGFGRLGPGPRGGGGGQAPNLFVQARAQDGTTVLATRAASAPQGQTTPSQPRLPATISMKDASAGAGIRTWSATSRCLRRTGPTATVSARRSRRTATTCSSWRSRCTTSTERCTGCC